MGPSCYMDKLHHDSFYNITYQNVCQINIKIVAILVTANVSLQNIDVSKFKSETPIQKGKLPNPIILDGFTYSVKGIQCYTFLFIHILLFRNYKLIHFWKQNHISTSSNRIFKKNAFLID